MQNPSVTHSTFVIERHYPASPQRVFAAFADPAKKLRWFGAGATRDFLEHQMDFQAGGHERTLSRMKEGTPFPGVILANHTTYQDIVPDRRIVFAYTMTMGDYCFSASLVTVELLPNDQGTDLIFTEQGAYFEGSDGGERRRHGWEELLQSLAQSLAD